MTWVDASGSIFFEHQGVLVHLPSGMQFPAEIGRFERVALPTVYDRMGYNVSVGYSRASGFFRTRRTTLTVYVYAGNLMVDAPQGPLHAEFQSSKIDVLKEHPDATLVEELDSTIPDAEGSVSGRVARFRIPAAGRETISEVYLFRRGVWLLKYRVTHEGRPQPAAKSDTSTVMKVLGCQRGT
jgi:hypothetical protein